MRKTEQTRFLLKGNMAVTALILLATVCLFLPQNGYAQQRVTKIEDNGVITLDDGREVLLAGIDLYPESKMMLSVLLTGKQVKVETVADARPAPKDPVPVLLFVETSEIPRPFPEKFEPSAKDVLVNELLLKFGAATVSETMLLPQRKDFIAAQEAARERGEGIWSYETSPSAPLE